MHTLISYKYIINELYKIPNSGVVIITHVRHIICEQNLVSEYYIMIIIIF